MLFGHHFAAISGAGPLIGPVLAIQYGYMPGLFWLVIGVCLAGAVQDMLVLAASVRRGGKSLAEIARAELGPLAGVVVSAGDPVHRRHRPGRAWASWWSRRWAARRSSWPTGTRIDAAGGAKPHRADRRRHATMLRFPAGMHDPLYADGSRGRRSRSVYDRQSQRAADGNARRSEPSASGSRHACRRAPRKLVPGSSWGTFTIACTIPIALFVGLYMYKIRKGQVVEASLIGAVGGAGRHGRRQLDSRLAAGAVFLADQASRRSWRSARYGFIASVLPVWMLLCPRDYLSSFLKIGTIALLVVGVIVANPTLQCADGQPRSSPAAAGRPSRAASSRSSSSASCAGPSPAFTPWCRPAPRPR